MPRGRIARLGATQDLQHGLLETFDANAAQEPAAPPPTPQAAPAPDTAPPEEEDDEAVLEPAEPDFRLVNLHTTERLPLHKGSFDLTHRFGGNLRRGSFADRASNFFGIDEGAIVGFEYRFAVMRHVQAAAYRSSLQKTIQFYTKIDAIHQSATRPGSLSLLVSIEGIDNFHNEYSPAIGAIISRQIGTVAAFYVSPMWVHNTALGAVDDRTTTFIGLGGRVRLRPNVYVVGEITPRVSGYKPGKPEYGFGVERRAGGHMFQLSFTNTFATTFGQVARGGFPATLYLGFNLSRKFF